MSQKVSGSITNPRSRREVGVSGPKPPKVSIVTVTQDRRDFIPHLIRTIEAQTFPLTDMEWVVADDGGEMTYDLVRDLSYVRYFWSSEKMPLGRKRNFANAQARGTYVFYFDDDDYSFPHRIEIGVRKLDENPAVMIVGSSDMYIFDQSLGKAYVTGPFGPNHATESTWGFRRSLLRKARYDDAASRATERAFTKNWSVPLLQIGRANTIVCLDHGANTVSKTHLAEHSKEFFAIEGIVSEPNACRFLKDVRQPQIEEI